MFGGWSSTRSPNPIGDGSWTSCAPANVLSARWSTLLRVSQPAVSKHLKVLRDAGLVEVRGDKQRRLYRLRLEPLRQLDDWLAPYRAHWDAALDALETRLEEHP